MSKMDNYRSKTGVRYRYIGTDDLEAPETFRSKRPDSVVDVTDDLIQLAFPEQCGQTANLDELQMCIRRSGSCDGWLLAYNPFGRDEHNRVTFRLDDELQCLPRGLYDAVLFQDCDPCGLVRLDKTKRRQLRADAPASTDFEDAPEPGGTLEGLEGDNMFEAHTGWTAKLTCPLTKDDTVLKVSAELPTPPDGGVELVLRDGVAKEIVRAVAVSEDTIMITRNDTLAAFPAGACVQFEWTVGNIGSIANQECEVVVAPYDPDTDTETETAKCTTLEPGKGVELDTSDDGVIKLQLAETGVAAGEYGGIKVNECGQIISIDAEFPASSLPVFDTCCKNEGGTGTDEDCEDNGTIVTP